ncbi:MAG: PrsW family intramembrane metalloprotease [Anaerolineae bacterium]|nr:PrsW family intramembrane metalloprotease [Anaerolineae bacterium]
MDMLRIVLALLIAIGIPGIFLLLIYFLDFYATRTFHLVVLCFLWGAIGALGLSYLINTYVSISLLIELRWDYILLYIAFAPVAEEIFKAVPLFFVSRHPKFTYFVDGAIYGFASGIGFSIVESFLYIFLYPHLAIAMATVRGISTCLMHGTTSALVGAAVGRFRSWRRARWRSMVIVGWVGAVLIHTLFNVVAVAIPSAAWGMLGAAFIGLGGLAATTLYIFLGLDEQHQWLAESLDQKMVDLVKADLTAEEQEWLAEMLDREAGITVAEVRASQAYDAIDDILEPIAAQFPHKAELMKRIVLQRAQVGIKRRILEKTVNPMAIKLLTEEIARLEENTRQLRKEAGPRAIAYLSCVYNRADEEVGVCFEDMLTNTESP